MSFMHFLEVRSNSHMEESGEFTLFVFQARDWRSQDIAILVYKVNQKKTIINSWIRC